MRFSTILPAFLVGTAFAATPVARTPTNVERDLATISGAISDIQGKVEALGTAVDGFQGADQVQSLTDAANAVLDSIKSGNEKVSGTDAINLTDALAVGNQVDGLTKIVSGAVDAAIGKKGTFDSAGASSTVGQVLGQFKDATTTFGATVSGKVPQEAQSIAQGKIDAIIAAIQKGVDAFGSRKHARAF